MQVVSLQWCPGQSMFLYGGNEIQRETIKSKGERGMMSLDMPHIIFTELILDYGSHQLTNQIASYAVSNFVRYLLRGI